MTSPSWDPDDIRKLRLRSLWSAFRREGVSFWLLCVYLMFEYVRPQSIYTWLDFLPWTTATMMAAAIAMLASKRIARVSTPANGLLVLFSFVLLLSTVAAYRPAASIAEFDGYFLWLVAYLLIIHIATTERRMLLMILAFVLFNLKMTQFAVRQWVSIGFGFRDWGTGGAPGWFQNSGEFGVEMCVFFPIITYLALGLRPQLPRWKFLALLGISASSLVGMVASSSRGALLGGAAVMLFMLARSRYKIRALAGGIVVGALLFLATPPEQKQRLSESGTDNSSLLRLAYWKNGIRMTNDHPLLGVGYANWMPYYRDHYEGQVQVPHNIFIQASAELGYTGLLAFVLLIWCTFLLNWRSRALAARAGPAGRLTYNLANGLDGALVGFLVSGFFVTILYYPFFWINLAMTVALNTVAKSLPVAAPAPMAQRIGDRLRTAATNDVPLGNPGSLPALPS